MIKSLIRAGQAFGRKMTRDATTAYSSDTTLYIVISFFPFLMFLLTLLKYLPFTQAELMEVVYNFVPSQVAAIIETLVNELYSTSSIMLSITLIGTLWTASRGVLGMYRGLNAIYGIRDTRNYFVIRILAMLYMLVFCIMLVLLLGLYVFGNLIMNWLTGWFPMVALNKYAILVMSFRTTIGIVILFIFFMVIYCFMPKRRPKFKYEFPGAVFASVGWVAFSYLYSIYIDNLGSMKATYGSLTAVVLCVLWLYFCIYLFFIGAEINSCVAMPETQRAIRRFLRKKEKPEK